MPIQTATNPKTGARLAFVDDQWKPIEQSATNPQGLKAYKIGGAWLTDEEMATAASEMMAGDVPAPDIGEIPGKRVEPKPFDLGDFARGVVETPGVLLTGAAGQIAGNVYGPVRSAIEGKYGTREGVQLAQKYAGEAAEALSYAPRTETGKNIVSGVSNFLNESKLAGLNPYTAGELAPLAGSAARQTVNALRNEAALIKPAITGPLEARKARIGEANITKSFENAAEIDATKKALKLNVAVNPAVSNPTAINRTKTTLAGEKNVNDNLSKINEYQFTRLAKQEMGIPANTKLDAKAFENALSKLSAPYDAVKAIEKLQPTPEIIDNLNSLKITRPTIGGEKSAKVVNDLIDDAISKVQLGRSGNEIITDIRKLRKNASNVYTAQQKSGVPDATILAEADANMSVANALESLIDANVADPKLLENLRKARVGMAKIYDYQRATTATNRIDAQALAKMAEDGRPLSGVAADIAEIARVFPEVTQSGKAGQPFWASERITRSGAGGTLGFGVGSLFGLPVVGALGGAVTGNVLGGLYGRRMANPSYQMKNALQTDFRPSVNNLAPKE